MDDTLNASQILHLALQKMDGIIASNGFAYIFSLQCTCCSLISFFSSLHVTLSAANSDVESLSIKSDLVLSNEDVHTEFQSASCYLKQSSINNHNNNNHFRHSNGNGQADKVSPASRHVNNINNSNNSNNSFKKQDKLNRLLQELKDYSLDDNEENEKKVEHLISENGNQPVKPSRRHQSAKPQNSEVNTTMIKPSRSKATSDIEVSRVNKSYSSSRKCTLNLMLT